MANIKSAAKRARQSERRESRNQSILSGIKTAQKKFRTALSNGKGEEARASYSNLASQLDKAAKRGIIHSNSADRRKSRFAGLLNKKG